MPRCDNSLLKIDKDRSKIGLIVVGVKLTIKARRPPIVGCLIEAGRRMIDVVGGLDKEQE